MENNKIKYSVNMDQFDSAIDTVDIIYKDEYLFLATARDETFLNEDNCIYIKLYVRIYKNILVGYTKVNKKDIEKFKTKEGAKKFFYSYIDTILCECLSINAKNMVYALRQVLTPEKLINLLEDKK